MAIPLILTLGDRSLEVTALLDTGASVNVLPYEIGLQLGALWETQMVSIPLSGNLARSDSRGLVVSGTIAQLSPILLGFAWTEMRDTPVIHSYQPNNTVERTYKVFALRSSSFAAAHFSRYTASFLSCGSPPTLSVCISS